MTAKELWDAACRLMRAEMNNATYNTWIVSALKPIEISDDQLLLEARTDFFHGYVTPRYSTQISDALSRAAGQPMRCGILTPAQAARLAEEHEHGPSEHDNAMLNPKYVFDNFVVGNSNRFAHAASLAVAESPAEAYNPLFLYGGVGLGKTHLMHAIGHFILDYNPSAHIKYTTSEAFTNDLILAIKNNKGGEFRTQYRSVDVLLVDDIQFIAGRDSTQEEFFHTFNALHAANKQIIISSDRPPKEISKLEERLCSRFEWGLVADIQKPDVDTRTAILRTKVQNDMIDIAPEALELIAERVDSNIRELEGCLTRLVAYAALVGQTKIDVALTEDALREVLSMHEPHHVTCDEIKDAVASYYNVTVEDIESSRRNHEVAAPRQIAMFLTRELAGLSLPRIGDFFGGRDHTTVMHACRKVAATMKESKQFDTLVHDLMRIIQEK